MHARIKLPSRAQSLLGITVSGTEKEKLWKFQQLNIEEIESKQAENSQGQSKWEETDEELFISSEMTAVNLCVLERKHQSLLFTILVDCIFCIPVGISARGIKTYWQSVKESQEKIRDCQWERTLSCLPLRVYVWIRDVLLIAARCI